MGFLLALLVHACSFMPYGSRITQLTKGIDGQHRKCSAGIIAYRYPFPRFIQFCITRRITARRLPVDRSKRACFFIERKGAYFSSIVTSLFSVTANTNFSSGETATKEGLEIFWLTDTASVAAVKLVNAFAFTIRGISAGIDVDIVRCVMAVKIRQITNVKGIDRMGILLYV